MRTPEADRRIQEWRKGTRESQVLSGFRPALCNVGGFARESPRILDADRGVVSPPGFRGLFLWQARRLRLGDAFDQSDRLESCPDEGGVDAIGSAVENTFIVATDAMSTC